MHDPDENKKLRSEMLMMMPMFLDIFHDLKSSSKSYPLIDMATLWERFIKNLDVSLHIENNLRNIITEACVQTDYGNIVQKKNNYSLSRSVLLEVLFRISTFLYTNQIIKKQTLKKVGKPNENMGKNKKEETNEYVELSLCQAFHLFVETKIKPYHAK